MTYRIKQIQIKHFLSHLDTKIELGDGLIVLVGPNGAGKSSIVDAIYHSLVVKRGGTNIRGVNQADLIYNGPGKTMNYAKITINLQDSYEHDLTVETIISKSSEREAKLRKNGKLLDKAIGKEAVGKLIASQFEIPRDNFEEVIKYAVIIRQNEFFEILDKFTTPNKERKELLQKLFGIYEYEQAWRNLGDLEIVSKYFGTLKPNKANIDRLIQFRTEIEKELRKLREEKERLEKEKQNTNKLLEELITEREETKQALDKIIEEHEKLSELLGQYRTLEELVEKRQKEYQKIKTQYENLNCKSVLEQAKSLEENILQEKATFNQLSELLIKIPNIERKIENLKTQYNELKDLNTLLGGKTLKQIENEIDKQGKELESIQRKRKEIDINLSNINRDLKSIQNYKERITKILNIETNTNISTLIKHIETNLNTLENEIRSLEEKITELKGKLQTVIIQIKDSEEKLSLLSRDKYTKCPLCGSPLTEERTRKLIEKLKEQIESGKKERENIERQIEQANRKLIALKDQLTRIQKEYNIVKNFYHEVKNRYNVEPEELINLVKALETKRQELDIREKQLREQQEELREKYVQAKTIARKYNINKVSDELLLELAKELEKQQNELAKIQETSSKLVERLATILGIPAESVDEVLEEYKKREQEYLAIREKHKHCTNYREKITTLEKEIQAAKEQIVRLKPSIMKYHEIRKKREELINKMNNINEKIQDLQNKLGEIVANLNNLEEKKKETEEKKQELEDYLRKLRILYYIREVYRNIPEEIYKQKLIMLQKYVSRIYRSFGLDYIDILVEETERGPRFIAVNRNGFKRNIELLSGGERIAFAIALVLALNMVLTGNIGFLILDEPTVGLDDERRRILVDVLSNLKTGENMLKGLKQLIIVTHADELKDAADEICIVSKEEGYSKVSCGEV